MGAVRQGVWINYSMRIMEPELWNEENIAKLKESGFGFPSNAIKPVEEYLSEMENQGGEDKSFREHVKFHIEKWNKLDDDPYWNFDERIYNFVNKVAESRMEKK